MKNGIWGKFKRQDEVKQDAPAEVKSSIVQPDDAPLTADLEFRAIPEKDRPSLDGYQKIPFATIGALGAGLVGLAATLKTVASGGLYTIAMPKGVSGTLQTKANGVTIGNIVGKTGKITARANFMPASGAAVAMTALNVEMLFITFALKDMQKQLGRIEETQREILDFLKTREESEMRGSLSSLKEILSDYAFNWDNETFLKASYIKAKDALQLSLQKVDFYRTAIHRHLNGRKSLIVNDQDVKKTIAAIEDDFKNYCTALHLYGFSSFMEVLLLKNFEREYLNKKAEDIRGHSYQYRELYTDCLGRVDDAASKSVQKKLLGHVAALTGGAGEVIAKIPVISKSQLDETLIRLGEDAGAYSDKRRDRIVGGMFGVRDPGVQPFIEQIDSMNRLYNEPVDILFDGENLYVAS